MNNHTCPKCEQKTLLSNENKFRPFCSEKCQNYDLGSWAQEKYSIPDSHKLHTQDGIVYTVYSDIDYDSEF